MDILKVVRVCLIFLNLLLVSLTCGATSGNLRPLHAGSFEQIPPTRTEQPFMLVLWSIDCAPCRHELELLSEVRRDGLRLPLVLIATDPWDDGEVVTEVLTEYGLQGAENWVFADSNHARLRFEIDSTWYGELPRSYFYDANHARTAFSGRLTRDVIENWTATHASAQ